MKKLILFACLGLCSLSAMAGGPTAASPLPPPPPPHYPPDQPPPPPPYYPSSCSVVYPGHNDRNNRHCANSSAYGVVFEGFFFSDTPCFSNVYDAQNAVRSEPACTQASYNGYCRLVYPGQSDRNNRHCVNTAAWGVSYNDYFFSDAPCFSSMGEASRAMQNTWSCRAPPYLGQCNLVSPGQNDRGNRHCVNPSAWGVAFNGYFISDAPCRSSMDEAMRMMQNEPACRR